MREYLIADKPNIKRELIEKWCSGFYSQGSLAREMGLPRTAVHDFLRRSGYTSRLRTDSTKHYGLNENFFDNIDSESKAYFLGLLYADGYNNEQLKSFTLCLGEGDKNILTQFNQVLESNRSLKYRIRKNEENNFQNTYTLNVVNKHMSEQLALLGCVQAKTFKIKFPEWLDENLWRHFIRGYFDGDGCVSGATFSLCGTEEFLLRIQEIFIKELGLTKTKLVKRHKERKNNITSLRYIGYKNLGGNL